MAGQGVAAAGDGLRASRLPTILQLLGQRDFRWLWLGESISWLGDQFYFVALAWMALRLTHSGLAIGTLLLVTLASSGISPISLGAAALVAGPHLIGMFTAAGALVLGAALFCGRSAALQAAA